MSEVDDKVGRALARFDRVMAVVDEKQGPVATQARRERQRSLSRYGRAASKAAVGVLVVSVLAILVGLFVPIGLFGFLAAVALAVGIAVLLLVNEVREEASLPVVPTDVPNGEMVQRFDTFLYRTRRALPAPAQTVVDGISQQLGTLKQTLERVDALDPDAQDARRLMSIHLPGLIDRYANVPTAYRREEDAEGKTVDQRLIEGLEASRSALSEVSERLAKRDMDAFQTHGRFIQSKYGEPDSPA